MMSSIRLSSQSRLEYWGPRRSDYIIPVRLETAFSQPNLQTLTGRALRDAAEITQRLLRLRKLWLTLEGEGMGVVYCLNQSVYILTCKTDLNKSAGSFGFEQNVSESWLRVI